LLIILIQHYIGKNEHKRAQLRKLAEINGTLRDNMWQNTSRTWASADVYCKYCGEISHPTVDCPLKGKQVDKEKIEAEYSNFLQEIGVDDTSSAANVVARTEAEKSYEEFMNSLQPKANPVKPTPPPSQGMPHLPPNAFMPPPRGPWEQQMGPGGPLRNPMMFFPGGPMPQMGPGGPVHPGFQPPPWGGPMAMPPPQGPNQYNGAPWSK